MFLHIELLLSFICCRTQQTPIKACSTVQHECSTSLVPASHDLNYGLRELTRMILHENNQPCAYIQHTNYFQLDHRVRGSVIFRETTTIPKENWSYLLTSMNNSIKDIHGQNKHGGYQARQRHLPHTPSGICLYYCSEVTKNARERPDTSMSSIALDCHSTMNDFLRPEYSNSHSSNPRTSLFYVYWETMFYCCAKLPAPPFPPTLIPLPPPTLPPLPVGATIPCGDC